MTHAATQPGAAQPGYTLTWRSRVGVMPVDGAVLRPDTLGQLKPDVLAAVTMPIGRTNAPLGELFDITGEPGDRLTLRGLPLLDHLGSRMASGELIIEGSAGDDLGAGMSGGVICVTGDVGQRAGGPARNSYRGMTGGQIHIAGNAAGYAGFRMRRGCITIAGTAGPGAGYRMIAGTLLVACGPYDHPGLEMQRGTLICLDRDQPMVAGEGGGKKGDAGFAIDGEFDAAALPIIRLTLLHLQRSGCTAVTDDAVNGRYRLHTGDRFELNKGELWQWVY